MFSFQKFNFFQYVLMQQIPVCVSEKSGFRKHSYLGVKSGFRKHNYLGECTKYII